MKKMTKRIMALMLSLAMILGCIPSFINEASAAISLVSDVLATVEGGFPSSNNRDYIPGNAWINNGNKMYVYDSKLYITHFADAAVSTTIMTSYNVTPDNGDYIYDTDTGFRYTFKMTDNVLTSVEYVRGSSYYNGTYEPVLGTIAEVLETTENGFPTTYTDGWTSEDGYKVYSNNDPSWLIFVTSNGGIFGPLSKDSSVISDDINNYSTDNGVKFNMSDKKLISIEYDGRKYEPNPIEEVTLGTEGRLAVGLDPDLGVTVPDDAKYSIDSQSDWYSGYDETTKEFVGNVTGSLDYRITYYKKITLKGNAGYEFNTDTTPVLNSIPNVDIVESSKEIEGNKYSFVIKKLADGKAEITFADDDGNVEDDSLVKDIKITSFTIIGGDNKTYTNEDCPTANDEEIKIYIENVTTPLNSDDDSTDKVIKEQTYKVEIVVDYENDFCDDSDNLSSWDDLIITDEFNYNITGTGDWIVRNPKLEVRNDNKLYFTMKLETKYIRSMHLDGEGTFNAGASTNYVYEAPENVNYEVVSTTWYKDEDCTDLLQTSELEEDTTYYAKVVIKPLDDYLFHLSSNEDYGYVPTISSYDGIVTNYVEIADDEKSLTCIIRKETPKTVTLTIEPVEDKSILLDVKRNPSLYITLDDQYCDEIETNVDGIATVDKKIGEYVVSIIMRDTYNGNYTTGIDTNSISQVIYNGQAYDVNRTMQEITSSNNNNISNMRDYLTGNKIRAITNYSKLFYSKPYTTVNDTTTETQTATIYKLYDFGIPGNITFSGLTAGSLTKNVSASGNLGTDGSVNAGIIEVGTVEGGAYTKINDSEAKFEAGKDYQIRFYIENKTFDINKLNINGEDVPVDFGNSYPTATGMNFSAGNVMLEFAQKMYITYNFTVQTPSSSGGGSKTYKAKDDKDTAEKISGSGKKGSKRIVTPQEGRKVESVIVTDKDGNRYEVTNEGDGTYSFIQPGKDVTVEVKYKNRLIELTIGSLDASVDDVHHQLDVVPKVVNDRTMLPIRFVAENLGAKVDWDEKDPDTVVITRGDTRIEITLGSDIAKVNGKDYMLDSVAFAENDRTYLPVRFVSEKLNAIVEWNEAHPMDVKIYERQ